MSQPDNNSPSARRAVLEAQAKEITDRLTKEKHRMPLPHYRQYLEMGIGVLRDLEMQAVALVRECPKQGDRACEAVAEQKREAARLWLAHNTP